MDITGAVTMWSQLVQKVPKWIKWTPPKQGSVKLNSDGAVDRSSGKAGAGGLIRDNEGIWITGFHVMVGKTDVLMAEIWGLREGLLLAKKCNLRRVEVESDSATLFKLLNGEVKEDHRLAKIIEECQNIMQEIDAQGIAHICREGNQCADILANKGLKSTPGVVHLDNPPGDILFQLQQDTNGSLYLRHWSLFCCGLGPLFLREKNFKQTIPQVKVGDGEEITYETATTALRRAVHFFSALQASDGYWPAESSGSLYFLPLLVFCMYITGHLNTTFPTEYRKEMLRYLYYHQNEDGGWGLHVEGHSTMLITALSYICMRILGEGPDGGLDNAVARARKWILDRAASLAFPLGDKLGFQY
ncbi:Ribonuclease H domain [Dillenia turbinata]|uniref:Ribonuclease H domain n=1 Tax=Dillenia turbinata TaxID=194707 RepID=A0AAN8VS66_9MAGN